MKRNKIKLLMVLSVLILSSILLLNTASAFVQSMCKNTALSSIEQQIAKNDFTNYDSLMIVAHPDDETIWGGNHLMKEKFVVVCITGEDNKVRNKEFFKVMKQSGSLGIMLHYPDKTNGKRDQWDTCKQQIYKDIDTILNKKKWKQIVTHNPDGEYGHIHHKMTSQLVSKATKQAGLEDELMYFGKYIKKKQRLEYAGKPELKDAISASELQQKEQLTMIYASQKKVMNHLEHMFPYENWISYHDWNKH